MFAVNEPCGVKGTLRLTLHKCKGLTDMAHIGEQDLFFKIKLDTEEEAKYRRSRVIEEAGTAAEWNQTFVLGPLKGDERHVNICVWSPGTVKDDLVAEAEWPVKDLLAQTQDQRRNPQWRFLMDPKNHVKSAGQAMVMVRFAPAEETDLLTNVDVMVAEESETQSKILDEKVQDEIPTQDKPKPATVAPNPVNESEVKEKSSESRRRLKTGNSEAWSHAAAATVSGASFSFLSSTGARSLTTCLRLRPLETDEVQNGDAAFLTSVSQSGSEEAKGKSEEEKTASGDRKADDVAALLRDDDFFAIRKPQPTTTDFVMWRQVSESEDLGGALDKSKKSRRSTRRSNRGQFTVHQVFPPSVSQNSMYNSLLRPAVELILNGSSEDRFFNVIVAGASESGKTFTISGDSGSYQSIGLLSRTLTHIFDYVALHSNDFEQWDVACRAVGVHEGTGYDFLSNQLTTLPRKECSTVRKPDKLDFKRVASEEEALELVELLSLNKAVCEMDSTAGSRARVAVGADDGLGAHVVFEIRLSRKRSFKMPPHLTDTKAGLDAVEEVDSAEPVVIRFVDLASNMVESDDDIAGTGSRETSTDSFEDEENLMFLSQMVTRRLPKKGPLALLLQSCMAENSHTFLVGCLASHNNDFEESLKSCRFVDFFTSKYLKGDVDTAKSKKSKSKSKNKDKDKDKDKDSKVSSAASSVAQGINRAVLAERLRKMPSTTAASATPAPAAVKAAEEKETTKEPKKTKKKDKSKRSKGKSADDVDTEKSASNPNDSKIDSKSKSAAASPTDMSPEAAEATGTEQSKSVTIGATAAAAAAAAAAARLELSKKGTDDSRDDNEAVSDATTDAGKTVASASKTAGGRELLSKAQSSMVLSSPSNQRLSKAEKSQLQAMVKMYVNDDSADAVLPINGNDTHKLQECFAQLKTMARKSRELEFMCRRLQEELSDSRQLMDLQEAKRLEAEAKLDEHGQAGKGGKARGKGKSQRASDKMSAKGSGNLSKRGSSSKVQAEVELGPLDGLENKADVDSDGETDDKPTFADPERDREATKAAFIRMLRNGVNMKKHCRRGDPHVRRFELTADGMLVWNSRKNKGIALDKIVALVDGPRTLPFQRAFPNADSYATDSKAQRCFAILTPSYSLNLEASSVEEKNVWVQGIHMLLPRLRWGDHQI